MEGLQKISHPLRLDSSFTMRYASLGCYGMRLMMMMIMTTTTTTTTTTMMMLMMMMIMMMMMMMMIEFLVYLSQRYPNSWLGDSYRFVNTYSNT